MAGSPEERNDASRQLTTEGGAGACLVTLRSPHVPRPDGAAEATVDRNTAATRRSLLSTLAAGRQALYVDGSLTSSRRFFGAAFDQAAQLGDGDAMVEAAVGLGGLWVHEHRGGAAHASVLLRQRQALAAAGTRTPHALELRLRLAAEDNYRHDRHESILPLIGTGRDSGRPEVLAAALSLAHHCVLGPDHGELRRGLAEEMVVAASGSSRPSDLAMALLWRTVDRFLAGDPHAERALTEVRAHLLQQPNRAVGFAVHGMAVMLAIRRGQLTKALALAEECLAAGLACGDADATGWFAAHQVTIHWYAGTLADIVPWLTGQMHSPELSDVDNSVHAAFAVAAAGVGDHQAASVALSQLGAGDLASLPRSSTWLVALYGAVEAASLLGDQETAAMAYHLLLPYRTLPMMVSLAAACFGSAEHALGVAALTLGDLDGAVAHLSQAIRHNLALGHVPAMIYSRRRLAEALTARGAPGDAERAAAELARAASAQAVLGMGSPAESSTMPAAATDRRPTRPPAGAAPEVTLRRRGRDWRVELGGRTAVVPHSIGMLYLAQLLANPGREVAAAELAAGQAGHDLVQADTMADTAHVVDEQALRHYRTRLAELASRIDGGGVPRSDADLRELIAERDWLTRELAGSTALSGRPRQFTTNAERARIAVGKAIRRAIDRIDAADPPLGEWLRASVQTGKRCCYRPGQPATTISGRDPAH
jgi:hypothetical protein